MAPSRLELSFRGGEVSVDLRARVLVVAGRAVRLGGRAFDVLHALIERSDRVVAKQELLDVVWPGVFVEENTLQVHVAALRKWLGAEAIVTVSGRGYRFTLIGDPPVHPLAGRDSGVPVAPAANDATPEHATAMPLIGRDALVASVAALLRRSDARLVTLTGPGGSGKTRLALQLAAELAPAFRDGAFTVMLAPLRDAALVASAIAAVLNVNEVGNQPLADLLVGYLREREVLLVLDNFEHLMPAAALVNDLLAQCPRLRVLVTSRSVLKLAGESDVAVPPLAVPSRHAAASEVPLASAVQLLRARALAVGRSVGGSAGELELVAEICRTLDGLPLAIELAAARLRMLSPQALLKRLTHRLHLLDGGAEDMPARQRTLRATLAWSHDLLAMPERRLFRRLAVFTDGWCIEAAEEVADLGDLPGGVLNLMTALLDQSLLQRIEDLAGEPRFAMLATVREYAQERLDASGEAPAVMQRHALYFIALAEAAEPVLTSPMRGPWIARLRLDYQNLRAALAWLVQQRGDAERGLRLAAALPWLWYFSGHYAEGRGWLRLALALEGSTTQPASVSRARALDGAARLATFSGDIPEALALAEQSIVLWRAAADRRGLGLALVNLGIASLLVSGRGPAVAAMEESLACFREIDDAWGIALATTYKGVVLAFGPGAESEAQPALTEGRARFIAIGDAWGASTAPGYLAGIAMRAGRYDRAREICEELLGGLIELGDTYRIGRGRHQLAEISLAQGRLDEARQHMLASLHISREQNRRGDAVQQLRLMARLEGLQDRHDRAVRLLATALRADMPKAALPPDDPALNQAALTAARNALGEERFAAEWALGVVMSVDQALAWALRDAGHVTAAR